MQPQFQRWLALHLNTSAPTTIQRPHKGKLPVQVLVFLEHNGPTLVKNLVGPRLSLIFVFIDFMV